LPTNDHSPRDSGKIAAMAADPEIGRLSRELFDRVNAHNYSYNFTWMGRPVIQFPQDLVALQEIIWEVRPELIVETGIAHGGSLVFSASMLELIGGPGHVVGIDIDIRAHNRVAIEEHPMARRITMIEGSSTAEAVVSQVRGHAEGRSRVLVILDSNHTHQHVLEELDLYSPLVTPGSYLVVFDTVIEDMPPDAFPDRPWARGDNPKTAVHEFLARSDRFEIDKEISDKLLITVAPDGYLRCIA
jgi:cephalosporin hydroxylase